MEDLQRHVGRQMKSTLSGRSTPRSSPTFRRLNSSRTPRRDGRSGAFNTHWFRSNRIVLWLLLITLWAYAGFYVQSRWAHGDNKDGIFGGSEQTDESSEPERIPRRDLFAKDDSLGLKIEINATQPDFNSRNVVLAKKSDDGSSLPRVTSKKKSRRSKRRMVRDKKKMVVAKENSEVEVQEEEIPMTNTTYGMLVGPFGSIEDGVLEWSPEKRSGTCDRRGAFARLVWSRKYVLIFHELSMTGAPLSMMELATELLSCGATVSAVVLSKKGGLMPELSRRGIKVLEDKEKGSFKTAMKADLVIAGSAVCASWIEGYLEHSVAGQRQLVWWIMENRREYFNRSKHVLDRVKMLIFLSESQSKQWLAWCEEEKIKLKSEPALVSLSVNDELAFVAGIATSLNTPAYSVEKMVEKRQLLRNSVRQEMGLTDDDMLVMSLSSINPGKGHFLLLESARLMIERGSSLNGLGIEGSAEKTEDYHWRALLQDRNPIKESSNGSQHSNGSFIRIKRRKRRNLRFPHVLKSMVDPDAVPSGNAGDVRKSLFENSTSEEKKEQKSLLEDSESEGKKEQKLLFENSESEGKKKQNLKVLIGSVGSKSNKVPYVKAIIRFLSQHSNLSNSVIWTPSTTRVASLYSAADVYVMNSQGLGETFGRVTVEAMAFGLPVLGTAAGGTKEIVEHNVTGLLHPLGKPGTQILSENLEFLLANPSARKQMGMRGRKKVENMYLKRHMYKMFTDAMLKSMRIR